MPIDFTIDHDRRLVTARGRGALTTDELFAYQRDVWLCPDAQRGSTRGLNDSENR